MIRSRLDGIKMAKQGGRTNFDKALKMMREDPESVFVRYGRMFSDLSRERLAKLRTVLDDLKAEQRADFYRAMEITNLNNFDYNYAPIAEIGMDDPDGEIRTAAIHVLGMEDSREIGARMLKAAGSDSYEKAQIAAIEILEQYMFEYTVDDRIPVDIDALHETLEQLIESENPAVRRAAVVAYAPSESDRVKEIISGYLAGNDPDELIAGLAAVRNALGEEWSQSVLELIRHEDEDVCIAAIRAAGALQLREALPALYEILSRFDRITPDMLTRTAEAVADIGDDSSVNILETLGEAVIDMDPGITDAIDESIDTLNLCIQMGFSDDDEDSDEEKKPEHVRAALREAIDTAADQCMSILEEKIPHDLEDDEPINIEGENDECDCGEHHHHHHHGHEHHHHDNPLEGMDLSRFRILDDLESYEKFADRDADEEELWAEFEDMAEEDLDADSLQDFINKLEKRKK